MIFVKRFRMRYEIGKVPPDSNLSSGFESIPWTDRDASWLLAAHADVKYRSFSDSIDSAVFPSLGNREGCYRLMHEIAHRPNLIKAATWLVRSVRSQTGVAPVSIQDCGTIQTVLDDAGSPSIQNLGVTTEFRGQGLATALLKLAINGVAALGHPFIWLEVTAENDQAFELYRRFGFVIERIVYKPQQE